MPHSLRSIHYTVSLFMCCALLGSSVANALDYIQLKRDGRTQQIQGKLLVEAQDGGLLLQSPDGVLWAVLPEELVKHAKDDRPFEPADATALSDLLLEELGDGFAVHRTAHYLIAYNTSKAYAQWCGALYERLYSSFYTYWGHRGLELQEPEQPLVAVVFDRKENYSRYARPELGDAVSSIIGYYNLQSNRVAMFDLTSTSVPRGNGSTSQCRAVAARSR